MDNDSIRVGSARNLHCLSVLACIVLVAQCSVAAAAPVSGVIRIMSEGYASGHGPEARDAAVVNATEHALRIWVESILGEPAGPAFLPIIQSPDAYAQSSRLIELEHDEIGTHVSVEVYVEEETLRADTAAVLMQTFRHPPRVVLLIGEQASPDEAQRFGSEGNSIAYLATALRGVGLEVLDPADVQSRYTQRELSTYLQGGFESVARFGRENNADVVIAGAVRTDLRVEGPRGQTLRVHALVELDVVRADDGLVYEITKTEAEVSCRIAADGARMAMQDATYKARNAVLVGTVLAAVQPKSGMPKFELRIENAIDWQEIERVARRLRRIESLDKVEVMRAQESTGIIQFKYSGKTAALVGILRAPFSDGRLMEPQFVAGGEMTFRFTNP